MSALIQNSVSENMEKIKILFQESSTYALQENNSVAVIEKLENIALEFRSVAYEAAAMVFAEQDIVAENQLKQWKTFYAQASTNYSIPLHVGLGWALAKGNNETIPFFNSLDSFMVPRVLDGMGYYDGIFKQRATIKNLKISDKFVTPLIKHYDQGVGRSIWYIAAGNPIKCNEIIDTFPTERKADLWRGIGIASVYVGGCDENTYNALKKIAKEHFSSLAVGAALSVKSRVESNSITNDIELVCKLLLKTTPNEMVETLNKFLQDTEANEYNKWLTAIEQHFISLNDF